MKGFSQIVYGLAALAAVAASPVEKRGPHVKYEGSQVIRVNLESNKDVTQLKSIVNGMGLSVWSPKYRPGGTVDVVIPPAHQKGFVKAASSLNTNMMHENLADSILKEIDYPVYAAGSQPNMTWFNSYHSYADHLQWLNDLHAAFPTQTKIVSAGKSYQGRDIMGIKIWPSDSSEGQKQVVVFHGTVHAREWIGTMVVEHFAYQLLQSGNSKYLENFEFHIFPVVNPDGFVYTQATDRMWRKNRMPPASSARCSSVGTDINRNWPSHWDTPGGASTDCGADDYRGASAGNTPENQALAAYQKSIQKPTKLYIDFHSYSQLLMSPYGYDCDTLPDNNAQTQTILKGWQAAIKKKYGTVFQYGPICSTIYQATGSSADWMKDVANVEYALAVELRDTGRYGFSLPPSQIPPSVDEAWLGMMFLLGNI